MDPHTEGLLRGIAESRFAREGMYGQHQMLGWILIGMLMAGVGFMVLALLVNKDAFSRYMFFFGLALCVLALLIFGGYKATVAPGPDTPRAESYGLDDSMENWKGAVRLLAIVAVFVICILFVGGA